MGWCVLLSVVSLSIRLAQACCHGVSKDLRETAQKHARPLEALAQKCTLFLASVTFCSQIKSCKQFSHVRRRNSLHFLMEVDLTKLFCGDREKAIVMARFTNI